ncbi:MAG: hypothetical protein JW841_15015 [Deltaproteobacteria bacterium]|nr:hypothetical protein [Deltaproteobacteria bacterium]
MVISNFLLTNSEIVLIDRYQGHAFITQQVYDELVAGIARGYNKLTAIDSLLNKNIFMLITLSETSRALYRELLTVLGPGEASCIASAILKNGVVISDDRAARNICNAKGVHYTGTIGILKATIVDKQLSLEKAEDILYRMKLAGYYSPILQLKDIL